MTPTVNRLREFGINPANAEAPRLRAGETDVNDDARLLRHYVETGSQDAFSEIVFRHSGWVFHACRRRLHDAHLAEDATQAVFLLLAKKAESLPPGTHIGGWLFQTCRFVVADVRKNQSRFVRRQEIAFSVQQQRLGDETQCAAEPDPVLGAAVDEAMSRLRDGDRQALLMHFYEGLTLRQMAEQLSITREGAKKRVMRAMSRLRAQLNGKLPGKGIVGSLAAMAIFLKAHSAAAAPADVVASIAASATIPGAASPLAQVIADSVRRSAAKATERLLTKLTIGSFTVPVILALVMMLPSRMGGGGMSGQRRNVAANSSSSMPVPLAGKSSGGAEEDDSILLPYYRDEQGPGKPIAVDLKPAPAAARFSLAPAPAQPPQQSQTPPVAAGTAPVPVALSATSGGSMILGTPGPAVLAKGSDFTPWIASAGSSPPQSLPRQPAATKHDDNHDAQPAVPPAPQLPKPPDGMAAGGPIPPGGAMPPHHGSPGPSGGSVATSPAPHAGWVDPGPPRQWADAPPVGVPTSHFDAVADLGSQPAAWDRPRMAEIIIRDRPSVMSVSEKASIDLDAGQPIWLDGKRAPKDDDHKGPPPMLNMAPPNLPPDMPVGDAPPCLPDMPPFLDDGAMPMKLPFDLPPDSIPHAAMDMYSAPAIAPEPGSLLLLAGLAGVLSTRRGRSRYH